MVDSQTDEEANKTDFRIPSTLHSGLISVHIQEKLSSALPLNSNSPTRYSGFFVLVLVCFHLMNMNVFMEYNNPVFLRKMRLQNTGPLLFQVFETC